MNVLSFMTRSSATLVEIIRIYYENSDLSRVECNIWMWKSINGWPPRKTTMNFLSRLFFSARIIKKAFLQASPRGESLFMFILLCHKSKKKCVIRQESISKTKKWPSQLNSKVSSNGCSIFCIFYDTAKVFTARKQD